MGLVSDGAGDFDIGVFMCTGVGGLNRAQAPSSSLWSRESWAFVKPGKDADLLG